MGIRHALAIPLAITTTLAITATTWATTALAANTQATITYDGGTYGTFPNEEHETDETKPETVTTVSYTVDTGVDQTVIDAPTMKGESVTQTPTPYDPQGGKLDNGADEAQWVCILTASKDNTTFKKWNTKEDGTGTDYTPGNKITVSEDTTLYAQWESTPAITHTKLLGATREGYTFDGWFTQAEGGELVGKAGETPSTEWDHKDVTTLYAHWTAIPATGNTESTKPSDLLQTGALREDLTPITIVTIIMGIAAILYLHTAKNARKNARRR